MFDVYVNPFKRRRWRRDEYPVCLGKTLDWVLGGTKTQFCRPIDPKFVRYAIASSGVGFWRKAPDGDGWQPYLIQQNVWGTAVRCPYGEPGKKLYIKEQVKCEYQNPNSSVLYLKDGVFRQGNNDVSTLKRMSPMYMPKWAARYWLLIRSIQVKQLHGLKPWEIRAEGISGENLQEAFQQYWDEAFHVGKDLNKSRWAWQRNKQWRWYRNNPWVWVISFSRIA